MPLIESLPQIRGRYSEKADLSKTNWFRVGGAAEVLFKPADIDDLCHFLKNKPAGTAITVLGVGSNIIIRDGGIDGVVIKLGREFAGLSLCSKNNHRVKAGAAALDLNTATFAAENNISGLEFLSGVPGGIGGAVTMNAGAYGSEIKDIIVKAEMVDLNGNIKILSNDELKFTYRKCGKMLEEPLIVTKAWLQGQLGDSQQIYTRMAEIKTAREESQPIRSRTGGSTFKNPQGHKAWQLIDAAGCRGLTIGGAQVSEKHTNFFINTGTATAADLENLIGEVQNRVYAKSGIRLETEIKIIGKAA